MTEPEPLQQTDRTYVLWRGKKLSYFAGCDYFRLASHPEVLKALEQGLQDFGLSVAASRLTTGNHVLYAKLEARLARFFGAPSALLTPSGYTASITVTQSLAGQFSHAVLDEAAHPSLRDAAEFLDCPILSYRHRSAHSVKRAIDRCGPGSKIIVLTDGLFSRDGSVAPLRAILQTLPRDALLLVDDAHGAGILGAKGRGSVEHTSIRDSRVIVTLTLSKAFGTYGGVALVSKQMRCRVVEKSRLFVGSTPLPLPLVAASLKAVEIVTKTPGLRDQLRRNASAVKTALRVAGIALPSYPGPIIALRPKNRASAAEVKRSLLRAGIYPSLIQYPGAPTDGYFRFVLSSEHTPDQIQALAGTLTRMAGHLLPLP